MITSDTRTTVTVAQLGTLDTWKARNARDLANQLQGAFQFDWLSEPLKLDKASYALPNGGYDLVRAAQEILTTAKVPRPLILLTSLPLSAPEDAEDANGFLFLSYDDPNVVIVSTHVWGEVLPGSRALQPFILYMLAGLALKHCSSLAYHVENKGCFFDSCDQVAEIDKAFEVRALCGNCERQLEYKLRKSELRVEQVAAAKRLLNRAYGKKVCFMAMPFKAALRPIYDLIARSLENEDWKVVRADEIARPRQVIDRILLAILSSDLVLADLTGNNPNVFYELGLAHAVSSDVILLTQNKTLPFDLSTEQTIFYQATESGLTKMAEKLVSLAGKGTW